VLAALLVVLAAVAVRATGSLRWRRLLAAEGPAPPAPATPGGPRRRRWERAEIMAGLLAACRLAREQDRQLTTRLLRELAQEDARIPSWDVVDRAARRAGATGGEWLARAEAQVLGEAPHLRIVPPDGPTEDEPRAGTGESSARMG
jgi:hypothetical protein